MRTWRDVTLGGALVALLFTCSAPLEPAARHYVVFESLQFALLALVMPALVVIGAPLARLGAIPGLRVITTRGEQLAAKRLRGSGGAAAVSALGVYLIALVFWQIPVVVGWVRASPPLLVVELFTFATVGTRFWSELVSSPPFRPRVRRMARVALAVAPMWTVWVLAYFIGFARSAWFPGFHHSAVVISTLADQQFATGVLWTVSAVVFLPVIFANFLRFLSEDEDLSEELRRLVRRERRASSGL